MKTRLLFVTEFYLPGGLERTLTDLVTGLDPGRFEVHLALKAPPEKVERLRRTLPATVTFHVPTLLAVQPWQDALAEAGLPGPVRLAARLALRFLRDVCLLADVALLWALIGRVSPHGLEVVNGGYPGGMVCLAALFAGRLRGLRSIGMYVLSHPQARKSGFLDRLLDRAVGACADRITSNSRAASRGFSALRGMPPDRVRTVHTGVDPAPAPEPARTARGPVVGMVAVFIPSKGHAVLLDAAELLAAKFPDVAYVLVGDGATRPALMERVRASGLKDRVSFPGALVGAEAIAGFDILAHPSFHEGFPNVVLEAMRAGKPVVASRLMGIPEQVEEGVTGLLTEPGDAAGLARALESLLADPARARALGEAGRRRFLANFTVTHMRDAFFSCYDAYARHG